MVFKIYSYVKTTRQDGPHVNKIYRVFQRLVVTDPDLDPTGYRYKAINIDDDNDIITFYVMDGGINDWKELKNYKHQQNAALASKELEESHNIFPMADEIYSYMKTDSARGKKTKYKKTKKNNKKNSRRRIK
jgi:hypothetical protein